MKKWVFFLFLFYFAPLLFSSFAFAQDSVRESEEQNKAVSFYRTSLGENSTLYKGRVYVGLNKLIKGHQFLDTDEWQPGSLYYKGNWYRDVPMLYDIFRDELVIQHTNGFLKIQLLKSELDKFHFLNSTFVNIQDSSSLKTLPSPGVYEKVYGGEVSVFVKRRKLVKETIQEMEVKREFEQTNQYFIQKENQYHEVKRKGSVLRVLKEHKKEIRKRMREEGIKFRRNPEAAIVKMVNFYEQAKN